MILILLTHKMLISAINRSVELQLQLTRFLLHFVCLITHFICEPAGSGLLKNRTHFIFDALNA
jgi:hypothetical protein